MSMPRSRRMLIARLEFLSRVMLQGSLSETTRTCGHPGCQCHQGKRHGPHVYLTFREKGRSSSLYVPPEELDRFRAGVEAWAEFRQIAGELAEMNRQSLREARSGRKRG